MSEAQIEEIAEMARIRLRVGDPLAAHLLLVIAALLESQEEVTRLRRHLGEIE